MCVVGGRGETKGWRGEGVGEGGRKDLRSESIIEGNSFLLALADDMHTKVVAEIQHQCFHGPARGITV